MPWPRTHNRDRWSGGTPKYVSVSATESPATSARTAPGTGGGSRRFTGASDAGSDAGSAPRPSRFLGAPERVGRRESTGRGHRARGGHEQEEDRHRRGRRDHDPRHPRAPLAATHRQLDEPEREDRHRERDDEPRARSRCPSSPVRSGVEPDVDRPVPQVEAVGDESDRRERRDPEQGRGRARVIAPAISAAAASATSENPPR